MNETIHLTGRRAGRRQQMVDEANEAARSGLTVMIASVNGSVWVTESPMTNAKVQPPRQDWNDPRIGEWIARWM